MLYERTKSECYDETDQGNENAYQTQWKILIKDLVGGRQRNVQIIKCKDGDLDAKDFATVKDKPTMKVSMKRIRFYECYEDEERRKD